MKKVLKILSGVLFVALLVGTFWFLWRKTRPVKILYAIVQPATDTLKQYVVATGKVQPRDEVEIKPQISGIISDVYKEAGETVRQGEVIATVKVVPEMGQLSSAESRVSVAEISLAQVQREYDRTAALHEKGIVSDEETEQSRTELAKAEEEPAQRTGESRNRQGGHRQPLRRAEQHADPIDDRRHDPRRADQGRQLGDPGQHVQRRHDDRHGGRHVEHAVPGQRGRDGRGQACTRECPCS